MFLKKIMSQLARHYEIITVQENVSTISEDGNEGNILIGRSTCDPGCCQKARISLKPKNQFLEIASESG